MHHPLAFFVSFFVAFVAGFWMAKLVIHFIRRP